MLSYESEYKKLNSAQKQAVDTIEGPLLVLAGPGTGKTTLLITRTARILTETDTLPENILCLTFTESAQKTMQSRLVNLIGQDAYKLHIHTFHSFGNWAMRTYPEYFRLQLTTKPADDVTRYQIFLSLFSRLDHHDPLSSINGGDYLYLRDTMTRIGHLKQAGRTSSGLAGICRVDESWLATFEKAIKSALKDVVTINRQVIANFENLLASIEPTQASKLGEKAAVELRLALSESSGNEKINTKPITAWKNNWLIKTRDGTFAAKYRKELEKLKSLAKIYGSYQKMMQKQALVDYDDMLLRLLETMENNPDFLAELQERFLYIMVDEYQDTNGVQDKILEKIATSPIYLDEPNVMIVGDDDQAIYGFQGAYTSNVLEFLKRWPKTKAITLTQNYRSTPEIVSFSRSVIVQGENRLEDNYEYINKELHTDNESGQKVTIIQANTPEESRLALANEINHCIGAGVKPGSITVLSPKHKYLEDFLPYLTNIGISVLYERRQDVLNEPHILELCLLAQVIVLVGKGNHKAAGELLPELLSLDWWGIRARSLWQTSLHASNQRSSWLEVMEKSSDKLLRQIAQWLIVQAKDVRQLPLEQMIDRLIGSKELSRSFDSPYRRYYFDQVTPKQHYLDMLTALITLRDHVRDYQGSEALHLQDFVDYVELRKQAGLPITNDHPISLGDDAVNLMTAYRAKGQEFDTVYILDGHHSVWGDPRGRKNLITMPGHIAAVPSGDSSDEWLRVFYVALSRAAKRLTVVTHKLDGKNNEILPLGWLENSVVRSQMKQAKIPPVDTNQLTTALSLEWQERVLPSGNNTWREVLGGIAKDYHLSPTHLNAFLDVANGGPRMFLINQLLRFPHALGPNASFGNAMHRLMQWLNSYTALPDIKAAKQHFGGELVNYHLGDIETSKQKVRGERAIEHLYANKNQLFDYRKTRVAERDFASEAVMIGDMRLKGKIDQMSIDKETNETIITDYKTGKPAYTWPNFGVKNFEALKLHKYRQQLLFYKLRVDNSRSYAGKLHTETARLVFLEPTNDSEELICLDLHYDKEELEHLQLLMQIVYKKIVTLDLPNTSQYSPDITGVRQFEEDLIST